VPVTSQPTATPVIDMREIFADQIALDQAPLAQVFVPGTVAPAGYLDAMLVERRPRARQELVPVYPQEAFARRAAGRVVVEVLIGESGCIDALRALDATPGFADSALGALGTITFDPALLEGRPVAARMLVELVYAVADSTVIRMD
jgi:TonB family protein